MRNYVIHRYTVATPVARLRLSKRVLIGVSAASRLLPQCRLVRSVFTLINSVSSFAGPQGVSTLSVVRKGDFWKNVASDGGVV